MAKAKSKRQLIRDERRKKKRELERGDDDEREAKRTRTRHNDGNGNDDEVPGGDVFFTDEHGKALEGVPVRSQGWPDRGPPEMGEFFGKLSDAEQEYFRRADELLELNDFAGGDDERRVFLASVWREAKGKELKLASSQSCSRLMERLVQVSSRRQQKRLFGAFAGHYGTLVRHRFASHCCEQLFLRGGEEDGAEEEGNEEENDNGDNDNDNGNEDKHTLAEHILFVLDELESQVSSLVSDRFASHVLRVLLLVLAGRPLDGAARALLRSKRKETVRVGGAVPVAAPDETATARKRPPLFAAALQKIRHDIAAALDPAALRVLAIHPTGNPVLQLLLELELEARKTKTADHGMDKNNDSVSLLDRLLPGAPGSLHDPASPAADVARTLVYDRVGARLLETLIVHAPAKLFRALGEAVFFDSTGRFATLLRNDVACYPAMRVLVRLGRDDLTRVVTDDLLAVPAAAAAAATATTTHARAGTVDLLVRNGRFSVLRTLLERCAARAVDRAVVQQLVHALEAAAGDHGLVAAVCWHCDKGNTGNTEKEDDGTLNPHGCALLTAMLALPGPSAVAAQTALRALSTDALVRLAMAAPAGARVLTAALQSEEAVRKSARPPLPPLCKHLVAQLVPHTLSLATSPAGHTILMAIVQTPSHSETEGLLRLPFHLKDAIVAQLAANEDTVRATWPGRAVWRAWRADLWRQQRAAWIRFAKAGEPEGMQVTSAPISAKAPRNERTQRMQRPPHRADTAKA